MRKTSTLKMNNFKRFIARTHMEAKWEILSRNYPGLRKSVEKSCEFDLASLKTAYIIKSTSSHKCRKKIA